MDLYEIIDKALVVGLSALFVVLAFRLTPDWRARVWLVGYVFLPTKIQMLALGCFFLWALHAEKIARRDTLGTGQRGPSRPTPSAPTEGVRLGPRPL